MLKAKRHLEQIKNYLEEIKKDLEEKISDSSLDFVSDHSLGDINYFSDAFHEFADNNISVYYSDQFKYYEEHATECENALLELCDGETIADKIKKEGLYNLCCYAGVCGQYNEIIGELYSDEENIKKLLIVRHLLKNDIFLIDKEQINDLLDAAESGNNDRADVFIYLISDYLGE